MRRRSVLMILTPLLAASLIGVGCGSGSNTDTATGGSTAPASSNDPAAILGSITSGDQTKPAKISLDLNVTLDGQIDNPQAQLVLGDGPIHVSLSGPVDPKAKSADLAFDATAGKISLPGKVRVIKGTEGYVELNSKWYKLPAGSLKSGTAKTAADPAATIDAIGNPADLLDGAKVVGSEMIDGIDTDHVSGTINVDGVAKALARAANSSGSSGSTVDQSSIDELKKALKSGTVDVWVGKDDKQVHRVKFDLDIAVPADQQSSTMGVTGAKVALTIQSTPVDGVSVSAPSGALDSSQLQTDLSGILLAGLGGGSQTP